MEEISSIQPPLQRPHTPLLDSHDVANLITIMSQELPIDTRTAFQEAQQNTVKEMRNSLYHMDNLSTLAFLSSNSKINKLSSIDPKDRPADVTFFCFRYDLDPTTIDPHIQQPPFSLQFCLRLPQHVYSVMDDTFEDIAGPTDLTDCTKELFASSTLDPLAAYHQLDITSSPQKKKAPKQDSDSKDEEEDKTPSTPARNPKPFSAVSPLQRCSASLAAMRTTLRLGISATPGS